jgi:mannan polymerase II complex MNN11 subunit
VVVTVVEPGPYSRQYLDNIKQNRIEYAKKHGV